MPFIWNRVTGGAAVSAPAGRLNILLNNVTLGTLTNKQLLARADASSLTIGDVILVFADRLSMLVGASKSETIVMSQADERFDISLKIGREGAAVTLTIQPEGKFPIKATYGKGIKSGEGNFQDLESLLRWLTQNLKI